MAPRTESHPPLLVCLLPARNAAEDLPGYLESAGRFADAIVALDDGSTDGTGALLERSPLVRILLTNPVRQTYAGWDDAANRSRLLAAAAELHPRWILNLDADERIDPDDGAALRHFVEHDADPACAYALQIHQMLDLEGRCAPAGPWFDRLFAHRPAQSLPARRLHLVPIPVSIPPDRYRRTTVRLQHLGGMTEERRRARFQKYREADPDREFQSSYAHLLDPPRQVLDWEPRPPGLPVLLNGRTTQPPPATDRDGDGPPRPWLSAIVISCDDEDRIERAVSSVVAQRCSRPMEVIVVTSGSDSTADIVRSRFPGVRLVQLPRPALPGEARNAGLAVARGRLVTFPGSHVELPPGSLEARVRAHQRGYAMVTGTALNGTRTAAGWAAYFLDHSDALPGRPSAELSAPRTCSYDREALRWAGDFPTGMRAGEDSLVNRRLFARGYGIYRERAAAFVHHSPCRTTAALLRHRLTRGRGMGRIAVAEMRTGARPFDRRCFQLTPLAIPGAVHWTAMNVVRWGPELRLRFAAVLPLVVAGACAYSLGACWELGRAAAEATLRSVCQPQPRIPSHR